MFTKLMDDLSTVYKGDIIYLPIKLKPFLEPWLHQRAAAKLGRGSKFQRSGFQSKSVTAKDNSYQYGSKKVIFFCEDELVNAYKKMPVPHVPEKITEEAFTIEFTLEEATAKKASSKPWQQAGAKKVDRKQKKGGQKLW